MLVLLLVRSFLYLEAGYSLLSSSLNSREKTSKEYLMHIAAMLSPEKVVDVTSIASGGNSRIYRVESSGKFFALKFYRNESKGL